MKKYLFFFALTISGLVQTRAQQNNSYMALGVYIEDNFMAAEVQQILKTKLQEIAMDNGIVDIGSFSRFILTPRVSVTSQEVLGTAPTQVVLNLNVSLCIGDGNSGKLFAYKSFNLKGVGRNELKAYMAALNRISANNSALTAFITSGKQKIIDFYNANCALILKEAGALEAQQQYRQALGMLGNVPVTSSCFDQISYDIKRLYQKVIDRQCTMLLAKAKAIWLANQDVNAAGKAGALLAMVEPNSACFGEGEYLFAQIGDRIREISDRPLD